MTLVEDNQDDATASVRCVACGGTYSAMRLQLGYRTCTDCGELHARRVKHTIVPVPKSNYVYAHTADDLVSPYSHKGNR